MDNETLTTENCSEEIMNTPLPDENESPDIATDNTPEPQPDIERLVSEAEQRGYMRGLNEQASRMIDMPCLGQQPDRQPAITGDQGEVMILNRSRVSVWNK